MALVRVKLLPRCLYGPIHSTIIEPLMFILCKKSSDVVLVLEHTFTIVHALQDKSISTAMLESDSRHPFLIKQHGTVKALSMYRNFLYSNLSVLFDILRQSSRRILWCECKHLKGGCHGGVVVNILQHLTQDNEPLRTEVVMHGRTKTEILGSRDAVEFSYQKFLTRHPRSTILSEETRCCGPWILRSVMTLNMVNYITDTYCVP
jgi:hypothetical protein